MTNTGDKYDYIVRGKRYSLTIWEDIDRKLYVKYHGKKYEVVKVYTECFVTYRVKER